MFRVDWRGPLTTGDHAISQVHGYWDYGRNGQGGSASYWVKCRLCGVIYHGCGWPDDLDKRHKVLD